MLRDLNQATLTELATGLDMPRSTLHSYLSAMVNQEYIDKENSTYRLGLRFVKEEMNDKEINDFYELSEFILEPLRRQTNEMVWLVVEEFGKRV